MDWNKALQVLRLGATGPQPPVRGPAPRPPDAGPDPLVVPRAAAICVASGKGGTGKTLVAASLAQHLAGAGPTLIVDADMGVANAHILQDVHPEGSLVDVIEGRASAREVVASVGENLDLLSGGSGFARMAGLSAFELHLVAAGIERLEVAYRHLVVDSSAGISNQNLAFATASDVVLLVTTPDVTAMTDAYAFLKVFLRRKPLGEVLLVVNRAADGAEARRTAGRIEEVSHKFLGRTPRWIATLPEDRAAFRCTQRRRPVLCAEPQSALGRALGGLVAVVEEELARNRPRGLGRTLLRHVARSPQLG